jgi:hypothetical protein
MQRHPSWNKPPESQIQGLSRLRKVYDEAGNLKRLELIDKGHEVTDQFWVKYQGKMIHFGIDFEEAAAVYDKLEQENF